jgi:hypothetical protein
MLKRIIFCIGVFFIKSELVLIMQLLTMINLCLILYGKPYIEHTLYKLELFNEAIALNFFVCIQMFKGDLLGPTDQYTGGWINMAVIGVYMSKHMIGNVMLSVNTAIDSCKKNKADKRKYENRMIKSA